MIKIFLNLWASVLAVQSNDVYKEATILGIIRHWVDVESHN